MTAVVYIFVIKKLNASYILNIDWEKQRQHECVVDAIVFYYRLPVKLKHGT